MKPFVTFVAPAAPLPVANVDTDKILPGRYLKTISREGLGSHLFADLRYDTNGQERPDFILNREPWRAAGVLVARDNFGCGSSREHAPWALADFGIRTIIAPSFADIFYNNCFKNGLLPITLPADEIESLLRIAGDPATAELCIDLVNQTVTSRTGYVAGFDISSDRKRALVEGLNDIDLSLAREADIVTWEQASSMIAPAIPQEIAFLSGR